MFISSGLEGKSRVGNSANQSEIFTDGVKLSNLILTLRVF